jgi:broad specificity phosphatase PhoE
MPILEVRRHSIRKTDGGSQLSQQGVDLARRLGAQSQPFDRVVTSVLPRARETAIAMGFAVDYELMTLAGNEVYAELQDMEWGDSKNPFPSIAGLISGGGEYETFANAMASLWRDILTPMRNDQRALFIGHSGEIEAALVACFPNDNHRNWGGAFGPFEGARIEFNGEPAHYKSVEILRTTKDT